MRLDKWGKPRLFVIEIGMLKQKISKYNRFSVFFFSSFPVDLSSKSLHSISLYIRLFSLLLLLATTILFATYILLNLFASSYSLNGANLSNRSRIAHYVFYFFF